MFTLWTKHDSQVSSTIFGKLPILQTTLFEYVSRNDTLNQATQEGTLNKWNFKDISLWKRFLFLGVGFTKINLERAWNYSGGCNQYVSILSFHADRNAVLLRRFEISMIFIKHVKFSFSFNDHFFFSKHNFWNKYSMSLQRNEGLSSCKTDFARSAAIRRDSNAIKRPIASIDDVNLRLTHNQAGAVCLRVILGRISTQWLGARGSRICGLR